MHSAFNKCLHMALRCSYRNVQGTGIQGWRWFRVNSKAASSWNRGDEYRKAYPWYSTLGYTGAEFHDPHYLGSSHGPLPRSASTHIIRKIFTCSQFYISLSTTLQHASLQRSWLRYKTWNWHCIELQTCTKHHSVKQTQILMTSAKI